MKHPLIFTAGTVVLSVVLIGSFLFAEEAEEGEKENSFRVEIRGLRIVGEGYAKESSMNPFNWRPGTSISLLIRAEDDNIIAFDDDESKLKSARDSRGGDLLKKVSFYDADGAEIESSPAGSSRSSFMGQVTTTRTYKLTEKIDTATVTFSFWEDWKKIPVPFSLNVGIGSCGE